jgi:hypothetical protein
MLQATIADSIARLQGDIAAAEQWIELGFLALSLLLGILLGWLIGYFQGVKEGRKQEIAAARRYGARPQLEREIA